jgi:hypothetical protein
MRTPIVLWLLLLASEPATAQGIHLRWTNCAAGGGTSNKAFACDTNSGSHVLVTSFALAQPMTVTTISGIIDIVAADFVLPAWWEFRGCRSGSLLLDSSFVPEDVCPLWNSGCTHLQGGINSYVVGAAGPNTARIDFTALSCGVARNLTAGAEYIGPVLAINSTRTVGSPSCAGCGTGVCLTLKQLQLGTTVLSTPAIPPSGNIVTWQGGGPGPGGICQAVTPTRLSAWGAVKSLYR